MNSDLLNAIQQAKKSKMSERVNQDDTKVFEKGIFSFHCSDLQNYNRYGETGVDFYQVGSDADSLLKNLRGQFDQERFGDFVNVSRQSVLNAIITPFGIAKILFQDKKGGNVTTLHNAENKVFATQEDAKRYNRPFVRRNFDQKNAMFKETKAKFKEQARNGELRDVYNSQRVLSEKEFIVNKLGQAKCRQGFDVEHINSCKGTHDRKDVKLFMDEKATCDLVNHPDNMGATRPALNRAKKNADPLKWRNSRDASGKTYMSKYEMNPDESLAAINKAKKVIDDTVKANKRDYYRENIRRTGFIEGGKMGIQQAIGFVLYELADAIYAEMVDVYHRGFSAGEAFFKALQKRLHRVCTAVVIKWKQILCSFAEGAVSGFISNLITTLVNMYMTTARNIVKIIREGFSSLVQAMRFIMFTPQHLTKNEAMHEAAKIVAAGISVGCGVFVEEFIQKAIMTVPVLIPIAGFIATGCSALITSLIGILAVYSLDKLDLFNAIAEAKHTFVIGELNKKTEGSMKRIEEILLSLKADRVESIMGKPSLSIVR